MFVETANKYIVTEKQNAENSKHICQSERKMSV